MSDTEVDVVAYLASKGFHGRKAGTEIAYPCFMDCGEPADSRKRKLHVNPTTGMWLCFVCNSSGGSFLMLKHFGDEPAKAQPRSRRGDVLEAATELAANMLRENDDVASYLS